MYLTSYLSVLNCFVLLATSQDPVRPYPLPDSFLGTTSILNHTDYIKDFDEPQWYLDNIPFVDFPDPQIQQIYYYRTSVLKRHLVYTHPGHGWIFTEFIQPVPWASKFQSIPDSAAHQIQEARWLRDPSYAKDTIQTYTRGGLETLTGISYTHYVHNAILEFAEANGDTNFLISQLEGMISTYYLWNTTRDDSTGLYHRTPLMDAQEFSLPGYLTGGPNGGEVQQWNSLQNNFPTIWQGPETYRPNLNAYMIAGARAISTVADIAGNLSLATIWNSTANDLYQKMQDLLWDDDISFWIDVVQGSELRAVGRQLIGLYPYRFGVATEEEYLPGIEASLTDQGFLSEFGPTTLEQINPYFTAEKNSSYCCLWNGQSWPFSTCVYLGTLARVARENSSTVITPEFFQDAFSIYTRTHFHQGQPGIFETHYPDRDAWSGYTANHSEHYLHSTYIDNVFTNLLGIIPSMNNTFQISPLIPANWTHFAVENLPYHGSLMSILWDEGGNAYPNYSHSQGLSIYANGSLIHNQPTLSQLSVSLPDKSNSSIASLASASKYVNILANPNTYVSPISRPFAKTTDSFTVAGNNLGPADTGYKTNDGLVFYDNPPDNYWTNNQTYQPASWLNFTLPRIRSFSSVTIAVYDDSARNGAIACPESVYIYASNTTDPANDVNGEKLIAQRTPWTTCHPNARNTLSLDNNVTISADAISLYFFNALHYAVAIAEVEIWVPATTGPRYEAEDGLIGFNSRGEAVGVNGTIINGGVRLDIGGILEFADVKTDQQAGGGGKTNLTILGYGGTVDIGLNYLGKITTVLPTQNDGNVTVEVNMLAGGNVVTIYQSGNDSVWIDAIVVG